MNNLAELTPISINGLKSPSKQVDTEILIGKDILDLLTGAMYVDPLCIYREYVQNSCDAIDEGQKAGLYVNGESPQIDISLDRVQRLVRVRDNGAGVANRDFLRVLTAIGGSHKRGSQLRGFRGVGRLSGLGYCQELVFRSRSVGDSKVVELIWDGRKLKEVLRAAAGKERLDDAVREVVEFRYLPGAEYPKHFFEVELRKLARVRNDLLLHEEEVRAYLSQIAPVPFSSTFGFGTEIEEFLGKYGANSVYKIILNDGLGAVCRPHNDSFPVNHTTKDQFTGVRAFTLEGMDGEIAGIGWILDHSYFGALPNRTGIAGFRLRSGNIQVGSSDLISNIFKESRFNGWCVGELHVLSSKVVPNGRRDDFEAGVHYHHLLSHLVPIAHEVSRICRNQSILRNRLKKAEALVSEARHALALLDGRNPPTFLVRFVKDRVTRVCDDLRRFANSSVFKDTENQLIAAQVVKLESMLERATRNRKVKSALRGANATKRAAYEHVLRLLYDVSFDVRDAHKLSARIIDALQKDLTS